jgi:hypothetical protein
MKCYSTAYVASSIFRHHIHDFTDGCAFWPFPACRNLKEAELNYLSSLLDSTQLKMSESYNSQTNEWKSSSGLDLKGSPIEGQSPGIGIEQSHNGLLFLRAERAKASACFSKRSDMRTGRATDDGNGDGL